MHVYWHNISTLKIHQSARSTLMSEIGEPQRHIIFEPFPAEAPAEPAAPAPTEQPAPKPARTTQVALWPAP
jgi:hypothetical protein